MRAARVRLLALVVAVGVTLTASARPAGARLDIDDQGPQLDIGRFAMRITNAGIIGNAFFDRGLSGDPSFEFPRGSGHEALGRAARAPRSTKMATDASMRKR